MSPQCEQGPEEFFFNAGSNTIAVEHRQFVKLFNAKPVVLSDAVAVAKRRHDGQRNADAVAVALQRELQTLTQSGSLTPSLTRRRRRLRR